MKRIAKVVLGALMLAGTAIGTAVPAAAHVSVGIGFGFPGYYGPPPRYYASCDPYSRYYDPYYCGDYADYYGPPIFVDGMWFNGGRYRDWHGEREYWVHGRWHGGGERGGGWHGGGHHH